MIKKIFLMALLVLLGIEAKPAWGSCSQYSSKDGDYFAGHASLVYFYMGDSYLTTLFQEALVLSDAFNGSDYNVLIYDDNATFGSAVLSGQAIREADKIYEPTKDNFFRAIRNVVKKGYTLDIYIISHGAINRDGQPYFAAQDDDITGDDIVEELGSYGCGEMPIRMVYSVACYHSEMNPYWLDVGAQAAGGSRFINFYPNQFSRFAKKWNAGYNYETAYDKSNTRLSRDMVHAYIYMLGLAYSNKGECGLWPNVLGENDCAEWYFTGGGDYDLGDDYVSSKSGADNMIRSSKKIIDGDENISINSTLWWYLPDLE